MEKKIKALIKTELEMGHLKKFNIFWWAKECLMQNLFMLRKRFYTKILAWNSIFKTWFVVGIFRFLKWFDVDAFDFQIYLWCRFFGIFWLDNYFSYFFEMAIFKNLLVTLLATSLQRWVNCNKMWPNSIECVVNAAFLFFETSKLWALIMYFVE